MADSSLSQVTATERSRRTFAEWILLSLAVALGGTGAVVAFFLAALVTSSVAAMSVMALGACLFTASALAWRAGAGLWQRKRLLLSAGVGVGTVLLVVLVADLTVLRPLARPSEPLKPPPGAAYWDLPTGSRIAYLKVPAVGEPKSTPIIRLHGGPGAYAVTNRTLVEFFGRLAQDGYDVYFYDQVGGGLSSRLSNPAAYTVSRHIADLEGVRQKIGAEQVILLGDSWGATLAANYMAMYPGRVAKLIATSPMPINYYEWPDTGNIANRLSLKQQEQVQNLLNQPRFALLTILSQINLQAAYNLTSDREMDSFFDDFTAHVMAGAACEPARYVATEPPHGLGFWCNMMTVHDAKTRNADARAPLILNRTPALILRGECDYITWDLAYQYKASLPNASLLYIRGAGHIIYHDQPDLYFSAIRAFLLDQPLPLQPFTG